MRGGTGFEHLGVGLTIVCQRTYMTIYFANEILMYYVSNKLRVQGAVSAHILFLICFCLVSCDKNVNEAAQLVNNYALQFCTFMF